MDTAERVGLARSKAKGANIQQDPEQFKRMDSDMKHILGVQGEIAMWYTFQTLGLQYPNLSVDDWVGDGGVDFNWLGVTWDVKTSARGSNMLMPYKVNDGKRSDVTIIDLPDGTREHNIRSRALVQAVKVVPDDGVTRAGNERVASRFVRMVGVISRKRFVHLAEWDTTKPTPCWIVPRVRLAPMDVFWAWAEQRYGME